MKKLILIGAGGHAKSVADSIDKEKYELCGFIDENKIGTHMGLPIFGKSFQDIKDYNHYCYFVAIGDVYYRKTWYEELVKNQLECINIIDSTAIISQSVKMGIGNFVGKMSIINADVEIGDDNIINTRAIVEHECKVGSHNHISTNAVVNGNVAVGDKVFMGSSSVCNGQLSIGSGAIIGSGSVIINDIPENVTVVGVPAKIIARRG